MMEQFNSADISAFSNVWVFCEQRSGKLMPTTLELISEGRKLADELHVKLCGVLLGDNVAGLVRELGGYGADQVYLCQSQLLKDYTTDAYAKVLCDLVAAHKPEILLVGASNIGRDLAPGVLPGFTPACAQTVPTWMWMYTSIWTFCVSPPPWTWTG